MTSTIKGTTCAKNIKPEPSSIDQEKPAITFNRVTIQISLYKFIRKTVTLKVQ
jgi:hypothetical protein